VFACQGGGGSSNATAGKESEATPDLDPSLNAQLAELAARQHGVVTAKQLDMTSGAITKRVRAGTLHRVHRGVYAVGHSRLSEKGMYMAAVLAAGKGAALSGLGAAALWKAWRRPVREIHVIAPRGRQRQSGSRLHTTRRLDKRDVTELDGIPVTTLGPHARRPHRRPDRPPARERDP
jgi:predicted transcriptional regulator of viral defense system